MATPALVTINGALSPLLGAKVVKFHISMPLRHSLGPSVVLPSTLEAVVAPDGTFTKPVYSCYDPDWNPTGWTYKVTIEGDNLKEEFLTSVPYGPTSMNFSELLPSLTFIEGALYAAYAHTQD